jgi:hypothetical protein
MNKYNDKGEFHGYWEHIWYYEGYGKVTYKGILDCGEKFGYWQRIKDDSEIIDKEFYL